MLRVKTFLFSILYDKVFFVEGEKEEASKLDKESPVKSDKTKKKLKNKFSILGSKLKSKGKFKTKSKQVQLLLSHLLIDFLD